MEKSKEYFDQIANQWDTMQESFFSVKVREKAYSMAEVQPEKLAADIGAGTGFVTEGLHRENVKVIAIDQSQEMLELLKHKFKDTGELQCIQADGHELPLPSESVDYAFANMYLHHVTSPLHAIGEMYRILKKGGRMVITDLDSHEHEFLRTEHQDLWMGFLREDIKKWYQEVGFREIKIEDVGAKCSSQSLCTCNQADISIFAAMGEK